MMMIMMVISLALLNEFLLFCLWILRYVCFVIFVSTLYVPLQSGISIGGMDFPLCVYMCIYLFAFFVI